ncbi:MAG: YjcZ family sporulation protein [Halobacillus sp.]|uniref:YjcZ family sporulation protein n=1 Tax=Halobacillus sp. TaxID=56800 RepID=UPI003BB13D60
MDNLNSPYAMAANMNAPYMGANVNAPYMDANVNAPYMMAPQMSCAPVRHCPPRKDNFILIIVLFILLIIVGCSISW